MFGHRIKDFSAKNRITTQKIPKRGDAEEKCNFCFPKKLRIIMLRWEST